MHAWVIGSGGLLGSAIVEHARPQATLFAGRPVQWSDPAAAASTLTEDLRRFADDTGDDDWVILWAAGSSVVSSSPQDTQPELVILGALVDAVADHRPAGRGAVFVTSSAGGVYAGSTPAPFGPSSRTSPISPYGELKLSQEKRAHDALAGHVPLVIGRFANLYGPRHNMTKGQGLIPQLCLASVRRQALNLYVSMDTVRDYIYIDDAAAYAWSAVCAAVDGPPDEATIVIIASGQPVTVAEVIATVQGVAHRKVPLALGTHPSSIHQAIDLRLTPTRIDDTVEITPLANGIKRVFDDMVGRVNA